MGNNVKPFMSVKEFSGYTGIGIVTVYAYCRVKGFPCLSVGRSKKIDTLAAVAWLSARAAEESLERGNGLRRFTQ